MQEIRPIAMPGIHQKFTQFFKNQPIPKEAKILDVGAGRGAFSQKLYQWGYQVTACDLFPEIFEFDKIPCHKTDVTGDFPFNDQQFDVAIAIEVSEHIIDHEQFFAEFKPGFKRQDIRGANIQRAPGL
jgi:2-polyprenyl-3-methyl-5-hydroxy-6-metoxy-1,4-benzoquinol methylase